MTARTLVLVGHGTADTHRRDPTISDHADAIRETGQYERVATGYVYGTPSIEETISSCQTEAIVVPFFMSAGYYTQEVIPERLADATPPPESITYTPPVGTHPNLTNVIRRQAEDVLDHPPEQTGLALIGHGSEKHDESGSSVRAHASRLRQRSTYSSVKSFFLDEEPRVDSLREAFHEEVVLLVPIFTSPGHHVTEDIPRRVGLHEGPENENYANTLYIADPVGVSPLLRDIVLDRASAAESNSEHPSVGAG